MKHILGIGGSPRRGGNSDLLLDRALEGAKSKGARVEKIILNELNFKACQECGGCDKTGICVLEDDLKIVYERIKGADAIILASPIFFGNVTAQLKSMIDRFQCIWVLKYILKKSFVRKKKKGIFLCVAASHNKKFFISARQVVRNFLATIDTDYTGELFCDGMETKGAVKNAKGMFDKAFDLGAGLVKNTVLVRGD